MNGLNKSTTFLSLTACALEVWEGGLITLPLLPVIRIGIKNSTQKTQLGFFGFENGKNPNKTPKIGFF